MNIDKLIEINAKYLDEIGECKVTFLERAENNIKFKNTKTYDHLLGTMLVEVMSQCIECKFEKDQDKQKMFDEFIADISNISILLKDLYLTRGEGNG